MTLTSFVLFIFGAVILWGGFTITLIIALKNKTK